MNILLRRRSNTINILPLEYNQNDIEYITMFKDVETKILQSFKIPTEHSKKASKLDLEHIRKIRNIQ